MDFLPIDWAWFSREVASLQCGSVNSQNLAWFEATHTAHNGQTWPADNP